jgi:hypothetical protein
MNSWFENGVLWGRVTILMGFEDSQGWENGAMTTQSNNNEFWNWKLHISMNNGTPKSN